MELVGGKWGKDSGMGNIIGWKSPVERRSNGNKMMMGVSLRKTQGSRADSPELRSLLAHI